MVYPTTWQEELVPVRDEMNKDHNEILKKLDKIGDGGKYSDVAKEYFEKKLAEKEEEYKKKIKG